MKLLSWLLFTILGVALSVEAGAQPSPKAQPEAAQLQLCLAEAADYSPVYPTQVFPSGTTHEVGAVVRLGKEESYRTMVATWTAVDVGAAAPPNPVIRKINMEMSKKDRAAVHMRSGGGPFPPGKYRLGVTADGKPWRSVEFSVVSLQAPDVKQPTDLLPLTPGIVWQYAFEQRFAPGVRPSISAGMKLDPDGSLRATLTRTAARTDEAGMHIETRRNNALVEEEWWRITEKGLVVTQLKSGGEVAKFDPPALIWPWPLKTPQEWSYVSPDQSFKQRWRMWGPLPVKGPAGESPGYVVLMEQPSPPISVSVERQYIPGIGMVRELIIQARNGAMLTRWENMLTAKPEGSK
jgi:hypothetical protein